MNNKVDMQFLNNELSGKTFDGLFIQNIITGKGDVMPIYTLKEKGSIVHHHISVLEGYFHHSKTYEAKSKRKGKVIEVLSSLTISSLKYVSEKSMERISFNFITHHKEYDYPVQFILTRREDGVYCDSPTPPVCHLLRYNTQSDKWELVRYLGGIHGRQLHQEQLFVGRDKYGVPLYTKDYVFVSEYNQHGVISYNFEKEEYVVVTDDKQELPYLAIRHLLVLKERKLVNYKGAKKTYSNIVSIFNWMIGDADDVRELLTEAYDCLSPADIIKEMEQALRNEIALDKVQIMKKANNYELQINHA